MDTDRWLFDKRKRKKVGTGIAYESPMENTERKRTKRVGYKF